MKSLVKDLIRLLVYIKSDVPIVFAEKKMKVALQKRLIFFWQKRAGSVFIYSMFENLMSGMFG